MNLNKLISENIKCFTPQNVVKELIFINSIYNEYIANVNLYINSIYNIIREINTLYQNLYCFCLTKVNGYDILSSVGYIFIYIIRYLENIKTQWYLYSLKLQSCFNNMRKYTSQLMVKLGPEDHLGTFRY